MNCELLNLKTCMHQWVFPIDIDNTIIKLMRETIFNHNFQNESTRNWTANKKLRVASSAYAKIKKHYLRMFDKEKPPG